MQVSRLIDYPENLVVSVAAIHAIADICESTVFMPASSHVPHKLFSILESAGELSTVMESFVRRLEREETEQVSLLFPPDAGPASLLQRIQEDDEFIGAFGLSNLIRLQILDFLTRNAAKPGFNLAHYLLGFSVDILSSPATLILPPPLADEKKGADGAAGQKGEPQSASQFTCLHLIMELLAYGLGHPSTPIVALDHPSLGQKCYDLLLVLLANPLTKKATCNFLRDHEDFYRKQAAFVSREPVDLTDVGFTIFEMNQKAALFAGAAIDLHMAFSDGAWSYSRRLSKVLVTGSLEPGEGEKDSTAAALDASDSLLSLHLAAVETVMSTDYLAPLPPLVQEQVVLSATALTRAISKVSQLMIMSLDRVPYDLQAMVKLQEHLITSLAPTIGRIAANQFAEDAIVEHCASLSLAICSFFKRLSFSRAEGGSASPGAFAGDEVVSLVILSLNALIRSDSHMATRGYLYAILPEAIEVLRTDDGAMKALLLVVRKELPRLIEVAAADSVLPALEAIGWRTMAITFLYCLLDLFRPSTIDGGDSASTISTIIDRLCRLGAMKSLVVSLRADDRALMHLLDASSETLNALYYWNAKLSLFAKMLGESALACERLIEFGFMDALAALRILDGPQAFGGVNLSLIDGSTQQHLNRLPLMEYRWNQIVLPIIQIVLILSTHSSPAIEATALTFVSSKAPIFERILRLKGGPLPSNYEHLKLISCTANLLAQIMPRGEHMQAYHQMMSNLLVKTLSALSEEDHEPASLPSGGGSNLSYASIVFSCMRFLSTELLNDKELIVVGFGDVSVESMAHAGIIPLPIFVRLLEWINAQMRRTGPTVNPAAARDADRLVTTLEHFLLIVFNSVERRVRSCADVNTIERELRHISLVLSPSLHQVNTDEKITRSKSRSIHLAKMLNALSRTISPTSQGGDASDGNVFL